MSSILGIWRPNPLDTQVDFSARGLMTLMQHIINTVLQSVGAERLISTRPTTTPKLRNLIACGDWWAKPCDLCKSIYDILTLYLSAASMDRTSRQERRPSHGLRAFSNPSRRHKESFRHRSPTYNCFPPCRICNRVCDASLWEASTGPYHHINLQHHWPITCWPSWVLELEVASACCEQYGYGALSGVSGADISHWCSIILPNNMEVDHSMVWACNYPQNLHTF